MEPRERGEGSGSFREDSWAVSFAFLRVASREGFLSICTGAYLGSFQENDDEPICGLVALVRGEPFLAFGEGELLAVGVVLHLVFTDGADLKVFGFSGKILHPCRSEGLSCL